MLDLGDIFIDSNNRAHRVLWSLPNPSCSRDGIETILVKTTPNAQPGDLFTHGIHNIQYTFNVSGIKQQVKCNISFTIKGTYQSGGGRGREVKGLLIQSITIRTRLMHVRTTF